MIMMTNKEFLNEASKTYLEVVLEEHKLVCDLIYDKIAERIESGDRLDFAMAALYIEDLKKSTQELADKYGIDKES